MQSYEAGGRGRWGFSEELVIFVRPTELEIQRLFSLGTVVRKKYTALTYIEFLNMDVIHNI